MDSNSTGFSLVSGIFQEYFSANDVLQGSKGDLAITGTTSTVRLSCTPYTRFDSSMM